MAEQDRTAAIIAIGDELTIGQKLDTNSQFIAQKLLDLGITVTRHATLDDDEHAIADEITRAATAHNVVIITGGLGPTADDLTRQGLAKALNENLEVDAPALETIEKRYRDANRTMPNANRVQAMRPASASMIQNPHGTAPGLRATIANTPIFCLPGPPSEMKPMFHDAVLPALAAPGTHIRTHLIQTFGLGESTVAERLADLMRRDRNPLVGTTASGGVVTVRIRATGQHTQIQPTIDEVTDLLGPSVFAEGETSLAQHIVNTLASRNESITTAESCTGGGIAHAITAIPGSSAVFSAAWVTYSNQQKTSQLGVPQATLEEHGAVSSQVAEAMAAGALKSSDAVHAVAVTGIAGPDGGTDTKPVGTVWISLASKNADHDTRRFVFPGDRDAVRDRIVSAALGMLRLRLDNQQLKLLWQHSD